MFSLFRLIFSFFALTRHANREVVDDGGAARVGLVKAGLTVNACIGENGRGEHNVSYVLGSTNQQQKMDEFIKTTETKRRLMTHLCAKNSSES